MLRHAWIAAAVAGLAGTASAQTQPATESADSARPEPRVVSPYWGQPSSLYPQSPTAGEPVVEKTILAVPQARADAVVARWTFRKLDKQLNLTANQLRRDFRSSDQYGAAVAEFKEAYAALESARAQAVRELIGTPEYRAIAELRSDVNDQLADQKMAKKPDLEKVAALAELKLENITPVRAAEIELLSNDPAVRDAKARLIRASRQLTQLESNFAKDVRESIDLAAIRRSREDAKIAMLASSAYLDEVRRARDIAIAYSLTSQFGPDDNDGYRYRYRHNNYNYGYGYSYFGGVYRSGVTAIGGLVGKVGNTPFGAGTNAFFGPSGNAFGGRGGNVLIAPGPGPSSQMTTR